jgi:hypothetical protein
VMAHAGLWRGELRFIAPSLAGKLAADHQQ